MRLVEHLSRNEREKTPYRFCLYLLYRTMAHTRCDRVAVLYLNRRTLWSKLFPAVDLYGPTRDVRTYQGPYPVIAHPPCGPWGKYKANCFQSKEDGILAMNLVHSFGGCVEQPVGSSLFRDHGKPGAVIEKVEQSLYGHQARKPTLLYFWR